MVKKKYDWWTRNYQNRLLIFGIMLTGFSIYQLPTIWTFKSNLTQIKGTLRAADTYVTNVTDQSGHNSRKSELIIYINGRQQKFYLAENIGNEWRFDKYEKISQGLKQADSVTVWVKKSEVDEYEPEVFQIDNDKTTLLDFEKVRTDKSPLTAFMLLLGLGSIALFLWLRFPNNFNRILRTNEKTN
ncbi:hypothetical protein A5893_17200 [Pedobacter psychrophilus]|uniref:Uncharacterized protein n=1 Tax=Pedobacter psychrophilus TaxID=1826909 RepID=A0A179DQX2_9SPHI|nr:hypothetical protein [Pedobacter psychrophilus]OAQ43497.1 hypothetical protein A5893_17200 [Pedobacter psychrophilus]